MRLILLLCLVTCGALNYSVAESPSKKNKITAKLVVGKVSFIRPPANKRRTIRTGTVLRQNDVIYTEEESSIEITFENGSIVTVEENALLKLSEIAEKIAEGKTTLKLTTGNLKFKINSLTGGLASFNFKTPVFTAAIRGTEGGIGIWEKNTMAYLSTGKMVMEPEGNMRAVEIDSLDLVVYNGEVLKKKTFLSVHHLDSAIQNVETAFKMKIGVGKIFKQPKKKTVKKTHPRLKEQLIFPVSD